MSPSLARTAIATNCGPRHRTTVIRATRYGYQQKAIYDLWGDVVNVAGRMESHGQAGRIQITDSTRQELDARYRTTPGGTVDVKGKGPMAVFFLEGRADA